MNALAALLAAPTHAVGSYTREAARALNDRRAAGVLEEFRADAPTTSDVQRLLGLGTPQAVHQLMVAIKTLKADVRETAAETPVDTTAAPAAAASATPP